MNKQTTIEATTLAASMALAFAEIEGAKKDASNPHFKAKFASLGSVMDAIKPALSKHGLFFTQASHVAEDGVCVETVIHHASGESLSCGQLYVPANKRDAQGFGSALTYARRYGLMTAFGVPAEDDDGNAAAASYRPTTGEIHPTNGPAPRTVLEGPYTSKTALKNAIHAIANSVLVAKSVEAVDSAVKAGKDAIKQAERDWPELLTGDPSLEGDDEGLKKLCARRREELTPRKQTDVFSFLASCVQECPTTNDFESAAGRVRRQDRGIGRRGVESLRRALQCSRVRAEAR
jgi:hypothetical protein